MKLLFRRILATSILIPGWILQDSHIHICSWRCAGMYHPESIKFFKTLRIIWC